MNYHTLFFSKIRKDVTKFVVCCSRDWRFKDTCIYFCPVEIIKGLTDKGQFQYLTKLKGHQEGTCLSTIQFLSLR